MAYQSELVTRKKRYFGEVIGDAFKIFFVNIKNYTLGFLMFVVPIFLVLALAFVSISSDFMGIILNGVDASILNGGVGGVLSSMGLLYLGLFLSYAVLYTLAYAGLKAHREAGDQAFSFESLKENIFKYAGTVIGTILVIIVVFIGVAILISIPVSIIGFVSPALTVIGFFILFPFLLYYAIITAFIVYIRVEEGLGIGEAFTRARYLIKDHWWPTFGTLFIAGIIAGLIGAVFNIPFYIATFASALGSVESGDGIEGSVMYAGLAYLLGVIGGLYTTIYSQIVLGLKYYDLVERKDSTQLKGKISTLGESSDTFFENEGEF